MKGKGSGRDKRTKGFSASGKNRPQFKAGKGRKLGGALFCKRELNSMLRETYHHLIFQKSNNNTREEKRKRGGGENYTGKEGLDKGMRRRGVDGKYVVKEGCGEGRCNGRDE